MEFFPLDHVHEVADYPYGFKFRTKARFYVETKTGKGSRSVSQTMNPKTGKWNKPKASTYSAVVRMYLNAEGHARFYHFTPYDHEGYAKALALNLFDGTEYPHAKVMRSVALQSIKWDTGFTGFSINGQPVENPLALPTITPAELEALKTSTDYETAHAISLAIKVRKNEMNDGRTI